MMIMKIKENKRYLLWLISLITAGILFVFITSSSLVPGKYLGLLGLLLVVLYGLLFVIQRKWRKISFVIAAIAEVLLIALCTYGISFLRHTENMLDRITRPTAETEEISVYVLQESPITDISEAVNYTWGIAEGQTKETMDQVLQKISLQQGKDIETQSYADMFDTADALKAGEVQVIALNSAFAGLISDLEGYEWFEDGARVLDSFTVEVLAEVEESVQTPETTSDRETEESTETGDTEQEELTDNQSESSSETDPNTAQTEENAQPEQIQAELMEPPEQVDWNALVNQEMLAPPEGSFIVYISGIDTWGSVGKKSRSDVNILAVVNTVNKKILLVSTPRDYYVPLSISNGVKDKLTHAGIYGINTSVETLELLYGVDISYYVRVNFTGFVGMIDALGGVDVYSDSAFTVGDAFSYTQGVNHMSGIEALAFARERYTFAGGDRARGTHQMEVIKAVLQKCISSSILYNYSDVMNSMSGCFSTNMPQDKIASLVRMQLNDMAQWEILSMSVDGTGASKTTYTVPGKKAYVMVPDESTVQAAKDSIAAVLQ